MLLRDTQESQGIEVFMVRRVVQSEFMPDIYVFPGGSVSADDRSAELTPGICAYIPPAMLDAEERRTRLGTGIRAAAIREMFEEANVLLAYRDDRILAINEDAIIRFEGYRRMFNERKGSLVELARGERLTLATDRLAYFAHWITPEGQPRRFDTHFFLANAPAEQEALYDNLETSDGVWTRPARALERFRAGKFPVAFPTFHQLRDLSAFTTVQQALEEAGKRYIPTYLPIMEQREDGMYVYLPEDPGHGWKL
jgi:8-oxo-dGTP pyrophosphatase MutT (NUDIX family)